MLGFRIKIHFLFFGMLLLLPLGVWSQTTQEIMEKGDKLFLKGGFADALAQYQLIESREPNNPKVKFRIGHVYLSTGRESKALPYLEDAYRLNPAVDEDIDYYLGVALQANAHFNRAIEHFKKFKKASRNLRDISDQKIAECRIGDSLKRNPVNCLIKVLEWPVNSMYQDYGPMLNADETELVFTSARDTVQKDKKQNILFEDILIAKSEGGVWTVPSRISPKINDSFHDAATYLTPNGRTIFLYYEKGNGDIYQSDFDGQDWSIPRSMGKEINTVSWEASGSLSHDGKKFFFSSDRSGGKGGLDLYVSEKLPNGQWGKAVNLGPLINTPGNEDAPFMAEDGTLYFGSDGHIGLGDYDIYKSQFKDGKWTKPVNLGYPINTPKFENYFFLTKDRHRAYFSAMRDEGLGNSDICMVTFIDPPPEPPVVKKEDVIVRIDTIRREAETIGDEFVDAMVSFQKDLGLATVLTGKVIDESSTTPLKAQIILVDNKMNKVIERVYSDPKTGDFKIVIPHGGNYGINTSVDGYLFNSMNFELPAFSDYQEIETAILMQKATLGSKVVMKNIFFDVGKAMLKDESIGELERILDLMQRNPDLKIQVNGHTDNSGDSQVNKVLSLNRAQAVMRFLVQRGVSDQRLRAVGFGEERPIVSNDDEEGGRAINRRTEIEVIK
jgi:outer membrane protein OmpA-like peptidoglycan-associated protein